MAVGAMEIERSPLPNSSMLQQSGPSLMKNEGHMDEAMRSYDGFPRNQLNRRPGPIVGSLIHQQGSDYSDKKTMGSTFDL